MARLSNQVLTGSPGFPIPHGVINLSSTLLPRVRHLFFHFCLLALFCVICYLKYHVYVIHLTGLFEIPLLNSHHNVVLLCALTFVYQTINY